MLFQSKDKMEKYAASISMRGVMFENKIPAKVGWKPLSKPYWYSSNKKIQERLFHLKNTYRKDNQTLEELTTTIVPYETRLSQNNLRKFDFFTIPNP